MPKLTVPVDVQAKAAGIILPPHLVLVSDPRDSPADQSWRICLDVPPGFREGDVNRALNRFGVKLFHVIDKYTKLFPKNYGSRLLLGTNQPLVQECRVIIGVLDLSIVMNIITDEVTRCEMQATK